LFFSLKTRESDAALRAASLSLVFYGDDRYMIAFELQGFNRQT
jgi:hypothetical protein